MFKNPVFKNSINLSARAIVLVWAAFWSLLLIPRPAARMELQGSLVYMLIIVGSALVACLWHRIGGVLLVLEGVALCVLLALWAHTLVTLNLILGWVPMLLFLFLSGVLPPLLAGILLLTARPRHLPQPG